MSETDRQKYRRVLREQKDERLMRSRAPVPWLITQALDAAELYGPEVDRALGGEEPMVDLWESGDLVPSWAQVEALAKLTGKRPAFFYRDDLVHPGAVGFLCGSGGCEVFAAGPPKAPDPLAQVVPIARGTLW